MPEGEHMLKMHGYSGDCPKPPLPRPLPTPDFLADVQEFMTKFGVDYEGPPRQLPRELADFRIGHMQEELDEYKNWDAAGRHFETAGANNSAREARAQQLDALVDLVYVTLQTAHKQGFNFAEAWRRVHAANMHKEAHPEGKGGIRKPKGWVAPDHLDLV